MLHLSAAQSRMQGHNRTLTHMQNSQDARKAKVYGKIGKLLVQAVKAGGADAVANARLKDVLKQAQQASVPKDIIDRNIKRASDKSQADFQEVCAQHMFLPLFGAAYAHANITCMTACGSVQQKFCLNYHIIAILV